jgi:hypothetical protein
VKVAVGSRRYYDTQKGRWIVENIWVEKGPGGSGTKPGGILDYLVPSPGVVDP